MHAPTPTPGNEGKRMEEERGKKRHRDQNTTGRARSMRVL
jgi:hypothetical protein